MTRSSLPLLFVFLVAATVRAEPKGKESAPPPAPVTLAEAVPLAEKIFTGKAERVIASRTRDGCWDIYTIYVTALRGLKGTVGRGEQFTFYDPRFLAGPRCTRPKAQRRYSATVDLDQLRQVEGIYFAGKELLTKFGSIFDASTAIEDEVKKLLSADGAKP
jgi:hypothetical protein